MDAARIETEVAQILAPRPKCCDCCDHPLQHVIRGVIARYHAPIPRPSLAEVIEGLEDELLQWEDAQ